MKSCFLETNQKSTFSVAIISGTVTRGPDKLKSDDSIGKGLSVREVAFYNNVAPLRNFTSKMTKCEKIAFLKLIKN